MKVKRVFLKQKHEENAALRWHAELEDGRECIIDYIDDAPTCFGVELDEQSLDEAFNA